MKARLGLFPLLCLATPSLGVLAAKSSLSLQSLDLLLVPILTLNILFIIITWKRNIIELDKGILEINSNLAFPSARNMPGPTIEHPLTSRNRTISVAQISEIKVITTTPSIPTRTSIDEINWRDRVEINYRQDNHPLTAIIELYLFPKTKTILKEIVKSHPLIKVTFEKLTGMQNVTQKPNPEY
jgi:hypothetical protein